MPTPSTRTATSTPARNHALVDPARVRANELGVIPVMMYHQIKPKITGPYDTTPRDFRAGLQRMFRAGFRPVRAIDLARGQLDVPAGYSPVVLTFDDGYANQLRLQPDGTVDPSCAVGILLDVCRQFPNCRPAATFNINKNPFGLDDAESRAAALTVLDRLGFEIGNHTYGHDNLAKMSVDWHRARFRAAAAPRFRSRTRPRGADDGAALRLDAAVAEGGISAAAWELGR